MEIKRIKKRIRDSDGFALCCVVVRESQRGVHKYIRAYVVDKGAIEPITATIAYVMYYPQAMDGTIEIKGDTEEIRQFVKGFYEALRIHNINYLISNITFL